MNALLRNNEPLAWLGSSDVAQLIRATDWSGTPVGPIEDWPSSLRTTLSICLHSSSPIAVYWGKELITFYNETCAQNIGDRHPGALGMPAAELYAEIWDFVGPILTTAYTKGVSTGSRNQPIPVPRDGRQREHHAERFRLAHSVQPRVEVRHADDAERRHPVKEQTGGEEQHRQRIQHHRRGPPRSK